MNIPPPPLAVRHGQQHRVALIDFHPMVMQVTGKGQDGTTRQTDARAMFLKKFGSKAALRYGGINPPLHDRKEHSAAAK